MSTPKKKIKIFVLVLLLFFSFLIYKAVESSLVYYLTVTEALEEKSQSQLKRLRVSGIVEKGSIKKNLDGSIAFNITDFNKTIHVEYKGEIPDIFKDEIEAVVEGKLVNKTFFANKLFAKCPTKYEDESLSSNKVNLVK
jgi:cytochrome c-type biogenesis protein CcmE